MSGVENETRLAWEQENVFQPDACGSAVPCPGPLQAVTCPISEPGPEQLLIKVSACGVCRTDLHIVDGELPHPKLPLIPGHEIVGRIAGMGNRVEGFQPGDRVGVPWLGGSCGTCDYCRRGQENLCNDARFTGYQIDGGYAGYTVAEARYCFSIPAMYSDAEAAPLLCAGLIGYRALRMAGGGEAHRAVRLWRRCTPAGTVVRAGGPGGVCLRASRR